jgi:uncharacterized protein
MRAWRHGLTVAAALVAAGVASGNVEAQQAPPPPARIVVVGEGTISVPADYARIRGGIVTRGKTAKEATDANTKQMSALLAALANAGIEQKDIQTAHFSVQAVYAPATANTEQKLTGFSVSNQVTVTVRQIARAGEFLDRLVELGATDIGGIEFLHADVSKTLDHAREAAMLDAKRKAAVYANAAGENLGAVLWITEESGFAPPGSPIPMRAAAAAVPVAIGEDTLHVRITVGFDLAR